MSEMEILEGRVVLTEMAAVTVMLFMVILALSVLATILVTLNMRKTVLVCLSLQGVCIFLMPMTFTLWAGPLIVVLGVLGLAKLFYDQRQGLES